MGRLCHDFPDSGRSGQPLSLVDERAVYGYRGYQPDDAGTDWYQLGYVCLGYTSVVNAGYGHGWAVLGSVTATFAVVLPSFILMLLISKFLMKFKNHPVVEHVFQGLRPAVVGLLAAAALLLLTPEKLRYTGQSVAVLYQYFFFLPLPLSVAWCIR